MQCETCNIDHSGLYGSGRFCSNSCSKIRKHLKGIPKTKQFEGLTLEQISDKKRRRREHCRSAASTGAKIKTANKLERIRNTAWNDLPKGNRKPRVLLEQDYKCLLCGLGNMWNGKELSFELDHIDGDHKNVARENFRCLCPNCHSQTDTYKAKNATGKKYSDEDIITALEKSSSVYIALTSLGMNPHGGNYVRIRKIIKRYDLKLSYLSL